MEFERSNALLEEAGERLCSQGLMEGSKQIVSLEKKGREDVVSIQRAKALSTRASVLMRLAAAL